MSAYQGFVWAATSGQWSWKIPHKNTDVVSGEGYENVNEATEERDIELKKFEIFERQIHVKKMLVNLNLDGLTPSPEDEDLYQAYV